jgi:hypothetical protein
MAGKAVPIKSSDSEKERGYDRSTIEFPYGDLDDALAVAEAIHQNAGVSCTVDQLAAYMKQSATSGAFRIRMSTARTFGLTENEKGAVTLTELGRRIVDSGQRAASSTEAFLRVPLYKAIHEKYRGHMLPPAAALEREMVGLGVAKKQSARARQAFERSAEQSGFFNHGKDRLVEPIARAVPAASPNPVDDPPRRQDGGGGGDGPIHPAIAGLLRTLPPSGATWPVVDRKTWLTAVESIFSLVYKDDAPRAKPQN